MKKMTIIGCLLIMATTAFAQPGWVKNASKSVFTLKTFSADGSLIASTNGFFTGTNGEAVSSFSPFKGASKAVIIDSQGKEFQVTGILGANDMYDVVKFRVNNSKCQPLTVSSVKGSVGSQAWLLPYHETKELRAGSIKRAETIFDDYAYYTVSMSIADNMVSCPLMNESGDVLGMMQQPATDKDTLSYAISARFVNDLKITGLTYNDATLQLTQIKKELPTDLKEANLVLYLAASQMDSLSYINLIEDYICQFPGEPDGYTARAIQAVNGGVSEIQTANSINSQPTYRQLEANILYAQKKYDEAYQIFNELTNTSLRNAEIFYSAAKCKEMLKDTMSMLALLDSTLNMFSKPYLKEAAPYLWARAEARSNAGKYRDAISDMNEYEELMQATVNDNFYYVRHQTDIKGRLYQQALNDINRAIQMNPQETLYYAEKASLEIRVGKYDDAILTAQDCINLDANNSDGYLFLGLAQCLKGQKAEGIKNLQKAKELGDTQADTLIEKYK